MSDLSGLSDDELKALYDRGAGISIRPAENDFSQMSDADLMKAYAAPSGIGSDAVNSIASGLGNATIGTLGMPGDISNLLAHGSQAATNYLAGKLGFDRGPQIGNTHLLQTSSDIRSTVTDPIVSPDYQPQTGLGEGLKTGAEFLPNMLTSGPEGVLARLGTNVAAPALGSMAGNAIGGPIGGVVGALAGGAGATKLANSIGTARALKAAAPSLTDTKSAATNVYDNLTAGNVAKPIPQSELDSISNDLRMRLNATGVRPSNAKGIHDAVGEIANPATPGAPDVQDLVAARESIKNHLSSPDASKKGAFIALPQIDAAIERLSPGTMNELRMADKNYAAFKASEALDKRVATADLRASGEHSGMNVGNKIRQQVTNYLLSNEAKYLSAETKAELEKVVRGTASQNVIRHVANLLGGGGGLGMLAGGTAGYEAGGVPGALAGAAAGRAFKMINNRSVTAQAQRVAEGIRRRSPLGQSMPLSLPAQSNPLLSGLSAALLARPKN